VADHPGLVDWVPPEGGVSSFVHLPGCDVDALCDRLAREERVLLVPGSCFGQPQFARLGFGCPERDLVEGLARLARLLAEERGEARRDEPGPAFAQDRRSAAGG